MSQKSFKRNFAVTISKLAASGLLGLFGVMNLTGCNPMGAQSFENGILTPLSGVHLGPAGSGSIIFSTKICSGYYGYNDFGILINGNATCLDNGIPANISGLVSWLKADAIFGLADGDKVASWPDSTTNGNGAAQSTLAQRPTYKASIAAINNRPVLRFNGTSSNMIISHKTSLAPSEISIFVLGMHNTDVDWEPFLMKTTTNAWNDGWGLAELSGNGTYNYGFFVNTYNATFVSTSLSTATYKLLEGIYDRTNVEYLINGASQGTQALAAAITTSTSDIYIGHYTLGAAKYLDGDIAEILIYNRGLNSTERKTIECYFSVKYALGLSGC